MYLTIMKPEVLREVALLERGLWVIEGPVELVLVLKMGKKFILSAPERREHKVYLA